MDLDFGVNQGLVEEQYFRYRENPAAVDPSWRSFFAELEAQHGALTSLDVPGEPGSDIATGNGNGHAEPMPAALPPTAEFVPNLGSQPPPEVMESNVLQGRVSAMVNAYRVRGHLYAQLDPLGRPMPGKDNELSLKAFGLDHIDESTPFSTGNMAGPSVLPLSELVRRLEDTYCRAIGVEYTFVENAEERSWLQERMESTCNRMDLSPEDQIMLLTKLTDAELFEQFLHTKYVGAKRFSLEGAETVIPLLELLIQRSASHEVEEIVIGMAHRGRLNVLANVMEKSLREMFFAFEDDRPELNIGRGDVKYHMGYSSDRYIEGHNVHLTLCFNPSHLEWVNPVVEGRVRAKQDRRGDARRSRVLPLVIHGDAAFAGQGVVAETLNLSRLQGYGTGGTIHVVINNQIGFTTAPEDSRSTWYCTDITRMLRCPVFHVNGEDPEAVAQAVQLAVDYRQKYQQDVVIDMYCYRRYGHNEADEPRYTQPVMYSAIDQQPSVRESYVRKLTGRGQITAEHAEEISSRRREEMEAELQEARRGSYVPPDYAMGGVWKGYVGGLDSECKEVSTAISPEMLADLAEKIVAVPEGFNLNPKAKRFLKDRRARARGEKAIDWGTGETLAYASLLQERVRLRMSGQDSRRGTFSHRHAVLFDSKTGKREMPLMHVGNELGDIEVWDSPLSEAGVLGFEYGYSLDTPDALVIWEAQFGDFANTAQVIIDQFICSSEDKWHRLSGLVLLLPHGFEGQGPEHSSARLERFLALCAEDNMQVCNLTTPAQLFHCMRRQVLRPYRKPLVIMSPKSLLRHPQATSTVDELTGGQFQRVIPDGSVDPSKVRRVVLCTGKVYYDLLAGRQEREVDDIALIRLEQLYPLQKQHLMAALEPYAEGTDVVWVQEEPWNSGGWAFMNARLPAMLDGRHPLRTVARPESASPATGSNAAHKVEQAELIATALED